MIKRVKWKIKNLGYLKFIKCCFEKKILVYISEVDINKNEENDIEVNIMENWKSIMLVKPSGYRHITSIIKYLRKSGHQIDSVHKIRNYNLLMRRLFKNVDSHEIYYWSKINEIYYKDEHGDTNAYVIIFKNSDSTSKLEVDKRQIRKLTGIDFYTIVEANKRTCETSITPVHVPDLANMKREYSIIMNHQPLELYTLKE